MGVAIAYVAVRPFLAALVPHLVIIEFPVALVLAALVMRKVARRSTKRAHAKEGAQIPLGTRHEQVVKRVPDPESERVRAVLERYVRTGEHRDEAVALLARAYAGREDPILVKEVEETLPRGGASSRRAASLRKLIARLEPQTGA